MAARETTSRLTVLFDARMPHARWGPLFHVYRLERPDVRLEWCPAALPGRCRPLLEGADVGLLLEPPPEPGLTRLTLDTSPMVVVVAAGDRLADRHELAIRDVLDRPFPGGPQLDPAWAAFWTLDAYRAGPPLCTTDDVRSAEEGLAVVAAGRAIVTVPAWMAGGLAHPGVVAIPLRDGPPVRTRLVWRSGTDDEPVRSLVDLARAWTRRGD